MTYGDVFLRAEREYSAYNFEFADTVMLSRHFADAEARMRRPAGRAKLALPAYDQCIKASHLFNLLDARGVISVTERASYIGRVRDLAKGCCEAWVPARLADARTLSRTVQRGNPRAHAGGRGRRPRRGCWRRALERPCPDSNPRPSTVRAASPLWPMSAPKLPTSPARRARPARHRAPEQALTGFLRKTRPRPRTQLRQEGDYWVLEKSAAGSIRRAT